eukprot:scaffold449368_cov38-Prasinocladus_malaysianus.AAC.1
MALLRGQDNASKFDFGIPETYEQQCNAMVSEASNRQYANACKTLNLWISEMRELSNEYFFWHHETMQNMYNIA